MSSRSTSISQTTTADQRTQIETLGAGSQFVAPGAMAVNPGGLAITAQGGTHGSSAKVDFGSVTVGMGGVEVKSILDSVFADREQERATTAGLGSSLAAGMQESTRQLSEIVAAAKTPDTSTLRTLTPVLLIVGVLFVLSKL